MKVTGRVWKYGDDVNTDVIIPARYLSLNDSQELARHCMEDLDPAFPSKVRPGDLLVAGKNFGCGSSREHAPLALQGAGIRCIIANTFARIFFRNAINLGLPIVECPEAAEAIQEGDEVEVDLESGQIRDLTTSQTFQAKPYPPFMMEIIKAGGLIPCTRQQLGIGIIR